MGKYHKEKIEILREHLYDIVGKDSYRYQYKSFTGNYIPSKKLNNAIKTFANGAKEDVVIGLVDTSVLSSGKAGYLFTDDKMYYSEVLEKPKKIWYDDIKSTEEQYGTLKLFQYDGEKVEISDKCIDIEGLKAFLDIMKDYDSQALDSTHDKTIERKQEKDNIGAKMGGLGIGAYRTVNTQYEEEKFHARQGHGFAAERSNDLYDRLTGHKAKIVGDDNAKNGADRIVDGVQIQSKYCASGKGCIDACFDEKGFRYYMNNGKPMQVEVPSDKYDEAVKAMEDKIRQGKVEGVTDPEEAKKIVRKGHFTYAQAKNIAKAGTIESLTYDSVKGMVTAASAFGVTATITLATSLWNGDDFDEAMKLATYSGLKVGGTAFVTSVLAAQLSKAGLNSAMVSSSEAIVSMMGPKASAMLVNAFRSGAKPIYGAAAMKSAAKLLRGNIITSGVTFVVMSSADVINIFQGKISGKQLFKNMVNTASTIGGGTGGWMAGAAAGSTILPGVGTIIGGIAGSMIGGAAAGKVSSGIMNGFIEDDANEMINIIQDVFVEVANEYLLNNKETEKATDKLKDKLDGNTLKEMYSRGFKENFARELLTPIIENEVLKRKFIPQISSEQMVASMRTVIEEIQDCEAAEA